MTPSYLLRLALLTSLYLVTGKLGLLLAVPPGYATLIWPPSGIAMAMLFGFGARLWPAVLLGSFLLNVYHAGVFATGDWWSARTLAAIGIGLGSTLQALAGAALLRRSLGMPMRLNTLGEVLQALLLAGPVVCVISASVGVGTLYALGILAPAELATNWLAWWSGDLLGVLVFLPLVLLAPGGREALRWRGRRVSRLPFAALLLLLLPLTVTFYAWKGVTDSDYLRGEARFHALAIESEKALENRLSSYGNALLGAAGFIEGSQRVSRAEWRAYVKALRLRENFPGVGGLGWIQPVATEDLPRFISDNQADGAPGFAVHPQGADEHFIVTFIEPDADNSGRLGLNLAVEAGPRAAAQHARDTGEITLTAPMAMTHGEQTEPGFLLLAPVYQKDMPTDTVEQRRAALLGWVFSPLIARHLLDDLTHSHSADFRLRIYDGAEETPASLVYVGDTAVAARPVFTLRSSFQILKRQWLLVWESSPVFEQAERVTNPLYILIGGLVFTALLALLLIVITVRRVEHLEQMISARLLALPLLVFLVIATGALTLHTRLRALEADFVAERARIEAAKIESVLQTQIHERVSALERMAARWSTAGGTEYRLWRADAAQHVAHLPGLRVLEWIDNSHRIRWAEPLAGNESVIGMDVGYDAQRRQALVEAASRRRPLLTRPFLLKQGYRAFLVYLPLQRQGADDGFLAGIFDIEEFFDSALRTATSQDFAVEMRHAGQIYYPMPQGAPAARAILEQTLRLDEQPWQLRLTPTATLLNARKSFLPTLVLVAGLLVAALAGLSVRYILISRLKSAHLAKSMALNAGITSSSAHLVIAVDHEYRIMTFNHAAEVGLGYSTAEVIGRRAMPLFFDAEEVQERARSLTQELGRPIPVGPRVFTEIPLRDGVESREWTFIRKDGTRLPVNMVVTPLRDGATTVTGYLGVIEDIRVRKEVETLKAEFTAVVSHELRTPLTSIRGSLGLVLGAFGASLPPKVRELLEIAQNNGERLMLLVNDILDVEKFSAGQMRFDLRVVPVAEVTRQAVDANEGYARRFGVQFDLANIDSRWLVRVDCDRFVQVMSNLLSNAVKYSPPTGCVRVWAERQGLAVRILVRDQGPGIPDDFHEHIFGKFTQADTSATREKGGTGLGLHIAKRFVEHMGGRIGYESREGEGATFWVELPLVTNAADPAPLSQNHE